MYSTHMHREKWTSLRKELDASHEANEDLRSKLCACNKELKETLENQGLKDSVQLYATSLESESYKAELKELQGKIAAIMSEREIERHDHKCKVKELSMRASCWEDEILNLTKRLDEQNVELAERRDNFSHVSSQLNAKNEQLNVMSAELRQSSAQLLAVSKELEETKAALVESKAEVERSQAQMAKYAVDAEMAQAEVQKSNRMLASRTEELDKKSSLAWRQVFIPC
jgi:chromosome segregation ATPase